MTRTAIVRFRIGSSFLVRALTMLAVVAVIAPDRARGQFAGPSWEQTSDSGVFSARLAPNGGEVRIGAFQAWTLQLRSRDGLPLERASIVVGGGMPGHGHGLPVRPVVTDYLGDGRYLVEGIRFSMSGRWILAFAIVAPDARDRLSFELDLGSGFEDVGQRLTSIALNAQSRPPPSPSNRVADDAAAARLGEALFFDTRLSKDGQMSCASCHRPERYFTDGKPRAVGINRIGRNTPSVVGAAYQSWFYWDGRRDSLWSQALVPFEAADEMGSSRVAVVRIVGSDPVYRSQYEKVFGDLPREILSHRLPANAGPLGEADTRNAWYGIDPDLAHSINTVYANLGKAIAAYERTLRVPVSRFDRYAAAVAADEQEPGRWMSDDELAGLNLFLDSTRTHCLRCHNGPWFSNGGFHNIGTGTFEGNNLDFGRVFGLRSVLMDEFNCLGRFSDAAPEQCTELRFLNKNSHVPIEGAFKVPSLRNLAATAPYMHDGRFPDLESVVDYYRAVPDRSTGHELPVLDISDEEARQLVAFLRSLGEESN